LYSLQLSRRKDKLQKIKGDLGDLCLLIKKVKIVANRICDLQTGCSKNSHIYICI